MVAVGHRVVGAVLARGDRVLLVHRSPGRSWYPDCWDLPGGHVEPAESARQALSRELFEELGIRVTVRGRPFGQVRGTDFRMDVWALSEWAGEPVNLDPEEHDAVAWFTVEELGRVPLADERIPELVRAGLEDAAEHGGAAGR